MDEVCHRFRQTREVFAFNESENLLRAVTQGVAAVAVADYCVVFGDRGLLFDDSVAACVNAFADFGVVEFDLGG